MTGCVCIINCFMGYFKPVILYARNSPTWTNYSYGKNQNLKKKSILFLLYTCSKITDYLGIYSVSCLQDSLKGVVTQSRAYIYKVQILIHIYPNIVRYNRLDISIPNSYSGLRNPATPKGWLKPILCTGMITIVFKW